MRPLVGLTPLADPELGIESMTSYLRRLGAIYSLSLNQILRYLTESKEVNDLAGTTPFRMTITDPTTLGGYAGNAVRLSRRVVAATGIHHIAATTLQRVGPSLTPRSTNSIVTKRRYCPHCFLQMKKWDDTPIWEPLVWSVATIACCPVHRQPMVEASHQWRSLELAVKEHVVDEKKSLPMTNADRWRCVETMRLINYCSAEPNDTTSKHSPSIFICQFLIQNRMSLADFSKLVGIGWSSIERKMHSCQGTSLKVVFNLAQKLALSPVDILSHPMETVLQMPLFDPSGDVGKCLVAQKNIHPAQTKDLLLKDFQQLLAADKELPPLEMVCRDRGVSPGFARYNMPSEVSSFTKRRWREMGERNANRHNAAYLIACKALTDPDDSDASVSIKRAEKVLRARSGLPKHLLLQALTEARRTLMSRL